MKQKIEFNQVIDFIKVIKKIFPDLVADSPVKGSGVLDKEGVCHALSVLYSFQEKAGVGGGYKVIESIAILSKKIAAMEKVSQLNTDEVRNFLEQNKKLLINLLKPITQIQGNIDNALPGSGNPNVSNDNIKNLVASIGSTQNDGNWEVAIQIASDTAHQVAISRKSGVYTYFDANFGVFSEVSFDEVKTLFDKSANILGQGMLKGQARFSIYQNTRLSVLQNTTAQVVGEMEKLVNSKNSFSIVPNRIEPDGSILKISQEYDSAFGKFKTIATKVSFSSDENGESVPNAKTITIGNVEEGVESSRLGDYIFEQLRSLNGDFSIKRLAKKDILKNHPIGALGGDEDAAETQIAKIKKLLDSNKYVQDFINEPKQKCEAASDYITKLLEINGIASEVRGIAIWKTPGDEMPSNHFVVIAKIEGKRIFIDVTAGQFSRPIEPKSIIGLERQWVDEFKALLSGKVAALYKDFFTHQKAKSEFGSEILGSDIGPQLHNSNLMELKIPEWLEDIRLLPEYGKIFVEVAQWKRLNPVKYAENIANLEKKLEPLKKELAAFKQVEERIKSGKISKLDSITTRQQLIEQAGEPSGPLSSFSAILEKLDAYHANQTALSSLEKISKLNEIARMAAGYADTHGSIISKKRAEVLRNFSDELRATILHILKQQDALGQVETGKGWEAPPLGELNHMIRNLPDGGGDLNYDRQLIIQLQDDNVSFESAKNLFGKHPKQSEWLQWKNGKASEAIGWDASKGELTQKIPLQLDANGTLRIVLVGHGTKKDGQTLHGGRTVQEISTLLQYLLEQMPAGKVRGIRLDLVGCQLMDSNQPLEATFPGKLTVWMVEKAEAFGIAKSAISISARQYPVRVTSDGRKEILVPDFGWIPKESARQNDVLHKTELVWDSKANNIIKKTLSRDELMMVGSELEPAMHDQTRSLLERQRLDTLHQQVVDEIRRDLLKKEAPTAEHRSAVEQKLLQLLHNTHQAQEWNDASNTLLRKHFGDRLADWIVTGETRAGSGVELRVLSKVTGQSQWLRSAPEHEALFLAFEKNQKLLHSDLSKGFVFDEKSGQWHPRADLVEGEAVHSLNAAFLLQTLMNINPKNGGLNQVSTALKVQAYAQLIQNGIGVLDDAGRALTLIKSAMGAEWKLLSNVGSVLGMLGSAALPALDVVNIGALIGELINDPKNIEVQTQLGLATISAGVNFGAIVAGLAGASTLSGILGTLGTPLTGLTIGMTALVDNFSKLRKGFDGAVQYFDNLLNAVAEPGLRLQDGVWSTKGAVVASIDFINGTLQYGNIQVSGTKGGGGHTRTGGWDNYFGRPGPDWNNLLDVYTGFGIAKKQHFNADNVKGAVLLPKFANRKLLTEYDQMPGARWLSPNAFMMLRKFYGEKFLWGMYALPTDWAIYKVTEFIEDTKMDIHLDGKNRQLIIPANLNQIMKKRWDAGWGWVDDGLEDESQRLSYHLHGNGGSYTVALPAKMVRNISISASQQPTEVWVLDMSEAIRNYQVTDGKLKFGTLKSGVFNELLAERERWPNGLKIGGQWVEFKGAPPATLMLKDTIASGISLLIEVDLPNKKHSTMVVLEQVLNDDSLKAIRLYLQQGEGKSLISDDMVTMVSGQKAWALDLNTGENLLLKDENGALRIDGREVQRVSRYLGSLCYFWNQQDQNVWVKSNADGTVKWSRREWNRNGYHHFVEKTADSHPTYTVREVNAGSALLQLNAMDLHLSSEGLRQTKIFLVLSAATRELALDQDLVGCAQIDILPEGQSSGEGLTVELPAQGQGWRWDVDGSDLLLVNSRGGVVKWLNTLGHAQHSARERMVIRLDGQDIQFADVFQRLLPVERHGGWIFGRYLGASASGEAYFLSKEGRSLTRFMLDGQHQIVHLPEKVTSSFMHDKQFSLCAESGLVYQLEKGELLLSGNIWQGVFYPGGHTKQHGYDIVRLENFYRNDTHIRYAYHAQGVWRYVDSRGLIFDDQFTSIVGKKQSDGNLNLTSHQISIRNGEVKIGLLGGEIQSFAVAGWVYDSNLKRINFPFDYKSVEQNSTGTLLLNYTSSNRFSGGTFVVMDGVLKLYGIDLRDIYIEPRLKAASYIDIIDQYKLGMLPDSVRPTDGEYIMISDSRVDSHSGLRGALSYATKFLNEKEPMANDHIIGLACMVYNGGVESNVIRYIGASRSVYDMSLSKIGVWHGGEILSDKSIIQNVVTSASAIKSEKLIESMSGMVSNQRVEDMEGRVMNTSVHDTRLALVH